MGMGGNGNGFMGMETEIVLPAHLYSNTTNHATTSSKRTTKLIADS